MNNLKKIGLSALAGSLVAVSANAGELAVSGSAEFTYTNKDGSTGSGNNITGNPYGAQQAISFTGSGDVGFGELTVVRTLNDDGSSNATSYSTLDMGDMGTISFDSNGGALVGTAANDDLLPTAYEEIWTGTSSSYVSGAASNNTLGYANAIGPVSFSAGYQKDGATANQSESSSSGAGITGSTSSYYASVDMGALLGVDGLTIGAGASESTQNSTSTLDADTKYVNGNINYNIGNVSLGYRQSQKNDGTAATASTKSSAYAIAFNVNENFAVSYGEQTTEKDAIGSTTTTVDEEVTGINATYTMGAASVRILNSVSDNDNFVSAAEQEHTEISLVLSF
jgi:outer membrane protein OmpU